MRSLHRKRYAHAKSRQRYHRRSAHTYKNHLPEDRRDLEKLTRERRNEDPVEQTQIELEIIFQSESRRCISKAGEFFSCSACAECQAARADESRNFSAAQ
jgi:hypothetical protein